MPGPGSGRPSNYQDILDFLTTTVDELELSTRAGSALVNHFGNGYTVRELVQKTEMELVDHRGPPNFGKVSLAELKEELSKHCVRFGMDLSDYPLPETRVQNRPAISQLEIINCPDSSELKDLLIRSLAGNPALQKKDLHLEIASSVLAVPLQWREVRTVVADGLMQGGEIEIELTGVKVNICINPKTKQGHLRFSL